VFECDNYAHSIFDVNILFMLIKKGQRISYNKKSCPTDGTAIGGRALTTVSLKHSIKPGARSESTCQRDIENLLFGRG